MLKQQIRYHNDHAVVTINGDYDDNMAHEFIDIGRSLREEKFYDRMDLHINSRGGELNALRQVLYTVKAWQKKGGVVATSASNMAMSSGAITLSAGTIGYRSVSPQARLVYHDCRTNLGNRALTSDAATRQAKQLDKIDAAVIEHLAQHICEGLGGLNAMVEEGLRRAAVLAQPAYASKPKAAMDFLSMPFGPRIEAIKTTQIFNQCGQKNSVDPFRKALHEVFNADRLIAAEQAWGLLLVDTVTDTPDLRPAPVLRLSSTSSVSLEEVQSQRSTQHHPSADTGVINRKPASPSQ